MTQESVPGIKALAFVSTTFISWENKTKKELQVNHSKRKSLYTELPFWKHSQLLLKPYGKVQNDNILKPSVTFTSSSQSEGIMLKGTSTILVWKGWKTKLLPWDESCQTEEMKELKDSSCPENLYCKLTVQK